MTEQESKPKAKSKAKPKKLTIEDIMRKKTAVTKKIVIQLDGEVAEEIVALRHAIIAARDNDRLSNKPDQESKLKVVLEDLIEKSRVTEQEFEFQSIGRYAYDALLENPKYKPTKQQVKEGANFNPDTFPPALVSASCISPEISLEQAEEIFSDPMWNGAELQRLFFTALGANTETGDIPLSKSGSDATLTSLLNLASLQTAESPTQSS